MMCTKLRNYEKNIDEKILRKKYVNKRAREEVEEAIF